MTLTAAMSVLRFRAIAKHSQDFCKKCHRHFGGVCRCMSQKGNRSQFHSKTTVIIAEHGAATNLVYISLQSQPFFYVQRIILERESRRSKRNIHKHQSK